MYGDDMLEIDMDSKCGILFFCLFGELTIKTRKKLNDVLEFLINVGIKNVVFNLENVYRIDDFKKFMLCYGHQIEKIILYHQTMDDVKKCYELLKNVHVEKLTVGVSVEISPLGINKASAVKWLCQYLNISSDEIFTYGLFISDLIAVIISSGDLPFSNLHRVFSIICSSSVFLSGPSLFTASRLVEISAIALLILATVFVKSFFS